MTHRVVAIARQWVGTPYVHQAAARGQGADCLGLIRGIWAELYQVPLPAVPAYSSDWSEPQGEERLWQAANLHLKAKPLDAVAVGDVLLFRIRRRALAKHLGVQGRIGDRASVIHAYSGIGVCESSLSRPWQNCIVARFEFP